MGRTVCTEPQRLYKGALYLYLSNLRVYGALFTYVTKTSCADCTCRLTVVHKSSYAVCVAYLSKYPPSLPPARRSFFCFISVKSFVAATVSCSLIANDAAEYILWMRKTHRLHPSVGLKSICVVQLLY